MKISATMKKLPKRALSVLMSILMVITAIPLTAPTAAAAPLPGGVYPRALPLGVLERYETAVGAGASGIIANGKAGDLLPGHTYIDANSVAMKSLVKRLDRLLGHTTKDGGPSGTTLPAGSANIAPFLELLMKPDGSDFVSQLMAMPKAPGQPTIGSDFATNPKQLHTILNAVVSDMLYQDSIINTLIDLLYKEVIGAFEGIWGNDVAGALKPMTGIDTGIAGQTATARPRMYPLYHSLAASTFYRSGDADPTIGTVEWAFGRDLRLYPNMFGAIIDSRTFPIARRLLTSNDGRSNSGVNSVDGNTAAARALADSLQYPSVFRRSWNPNDIGIDANVFPYTESTEWREGGENAYGNTNAQPTAAATTDRSSQMQKVYKESDGSDRPNPWSANPYRGTPQLYRIHPTMSNATEVCGHGHLWPLESNLTAVYNGVTGADHIADCLAAGNEKVWDAVLEVEIDTGIAYYSAHKNADESHPLNIPWNINGDAAKFAEALRYVFHGIWPIVAGLLTDVQKVKKGIIGPVTIDNVLAQGVAADGIQLELAFRNMPVFAALLNPIFEAVLGLESADYTLTPQQLIDIGTKNPGSRATGATSSYGARDIKQNYNNDVVLYTDTKTPTHAYTNTAARRNASQDNATGATPANRSDGPQDLVNAVLYCIEGLIGAISEQPASKLVGLLTNLLYAVDEDRIRPLLNTLNLIIGIDVFAVNVHVTGILSCISMGEWMWVDVGLQPVNMNLIEMFAGDPVIAGYIEGLGSAQGLQNIFNDTGLTAPGGLLAGLDISRLPTGIGTVHTTLPTKRYAGTSINMHGTKANVPYDNVRHWAEPDPRILTDVVHWALSSSLLWDPTTGLLVNKDDTSPEFGQPLFTMNSNSDWEVITAIAELVLPKDYSFTEPGPLELNPPPAAPAFQYPEWWGQRGQSYHNDPIPYDPDAPDYGTGDTDGKEFQVDVEYLIANIDVILDALLDVAFGSVPASGWQNLLSQILNKTPSASDPAGTPLDTLTAFNPFTKETFVLLVEGIQTALGTVLDKVPDPKPDAQPGDPPPATLRETLTDFSAILDRAIVVQGSGNVPTNTADHALNLMGAIDKLSDPLSYNPNSAIITNSAEFANALAAFISPLGDILGVLLTEKSLGILQIREGAGETLLEIKGGNGWAEIKTLMDALTNAMGVPSLMSAAPATSNIALELIKPILALVDELLKDPAKNLLSVLPTLAYYLLPQDADGDGWTPGEPDAPINQILQRLLRPVYILLDTVRPIIDLFGGELLDIQSMLANLPFLKIVQNKAPLDPQFNPGLNLDVYGLFDFLDDKIANPASGDPLPIPEIEGLLRMFMVGKFDEAGGAKYIKADLPQLLFTLVNFVLENFLADIIGADNINWIYDEAGYEFFTRLIQYKKVPGYGPIDYAEAPPVYAPLPTDATYGAVNTNLSWFKKSQSQYLVENIDVVINFLWNNLVYDNNNTAVAPGSLTGLNGLVQGALDWLRDIKVPAQNGEKLALTVEPTLQETVYSAFGNTAYAQEILTMVVNIVLGEVGNVVGDGIDFKKDGLLGILGDGATPGELDVMINKLIDEKVADTLLGIGLKLNEISVANVLQKLIAIGDFPLDLAAIFKPFKEYRNGDPGYQVTSKDSFIDVAAKLFQPLFPILDFLLSGENLKLLAVDGLVHNANQDDTINEEWNPDAPGAQSNDDASGGKGKGLITAYGYDGYEFGLMPLLLGIGADIPGFQAKVMTPALFKDPATAAANGQLKAILDPVFALLDAFLKNPVQTAMQVLPNVVYMMTNSSGIAGSDTSILQQALNRLLQPAWELLALLNHTKINTLLDKLDPTLDKILGTLGLPDGSGLKGFQNLNLGKFVQDKLSGLLAQFAPGFEMTELLCGTQTAFTNPLHHGAGIHNHDLAVLTGGDYLHVDMADLLVALLLQFNIIGDPATALAKDFQTLIGILGDGGIVLGGKAGKIDYSLTDNVVDYILPQWFMDTKAPQYLTKNLDTVFNYLWKEAIVGDTTPGGLNETLTDLLNGLVPADGGALDNILGDGGIVLEDTLKDTLWQVFDGGVYADKTFKVLINLMKEKLSGLTDKLPAGFSLDILDQFPVTVPADAPILDGEINLLEILSRLVKIDGKPIDFNAIMKMFLSTDPLDFSAYTAQFPNLADGIDSETDFYDALGVVLGPVMPILSLFLAGGSVEIIEVDGLTPETTITPGAVNVPNVFFNITGLDGYANLLPILMGIGAAVPGYVGTLKTPDEFKAGGPGTPTAEAKAAYQVKAIFEPIMTLLGTLLDKPAETLLQVLPNLVYLISQNGTGKSIVQQCADQLLVTVNSVLDLVNGLGVLDNPIDLTDLLKGFDLDNLYDSISEKIASDDPTNFLYQFNIGNFLYGTKTQFNTLPAPGAALEIVGKYANAHADYADYIEVDLAEYLTFLLDKLLPGGVTTLEKYEYLLTILGNGGISFAGSGEKILYDPDQIREEAVTATDATWLRSTKAADYLAANMDTVIDFLWQEVIVKTPSVADPIEEFVNGFIKDFNLKFKLENSIEETVWGLLGTQTYTKKNLLVIIKGLQDKLNEINVPIFKDFDALKEFIEGGGSIDFDLADLDVAGLQGSGTINLFDLIGKLIFINGNPIPINGVLNHFLDLVYDDATWKSINVYDEASFLNALADLVGPIMPILSILLAGGTLDFVDITGSTVGAGGTDIYPMDGGVRPGMEGKQSVFLSIKGPDAYGTVLLPLLMGLVGGFGTDGEDTLMLPSVFNASTTSGEEQVKAIFGPIVFTLNRLLEQPVDTLLKLLPNLMYLITDAGDDTGADESILQQAINNMLVPLEGVIAFVDSMLGGGKINLSDIELSATMKLNINKLHLDKMLNDLLSGSVGLDLKKLMLGAPGLFADTGFGEAVGYVDSLNWGTFADYANFVDVSTPEVLIALLEELLPRGIESIENFEYLLEILGKGGIDLSKDAGLIDYDETLIYEDAPTAKPNHSWLHSTNAAEYLTGNIDTVIDFLWREVIADETIGIADVLKDLLDGVLPAALKGASGVEIEDSLSATVWGILGKQAYTETNLWALIEGLQNTLAGLNIPFDELEAFDLSTLDLGDIDLPATSINVFELIGKIIFVNDEPIEIQGLITHFLGLKEADFSFPLNDREDFFTALDSLIGPILPILTILLAGGSLEIINLKDTGLGEAGELFPIDGGAPGMDGKEGVFLSIKGPDAYSTVILPLLMALVGGFEKEGMLLSQDDFLKATDSIDQIKAIFEPIMFVIDRLLEQPVDTLLTLLPNILFLLVDENSGAAFDPLLQNNSILQQALNNMLLPLEGVLGMVNKFLTKPIDINNIPLKINDDLTIPLDLENLPLNMVFEAVGGIGIDLTKLVIGSRDAFANPKLGDGYVSKNGESFYAGDNGAESQTANMLIMLIDMLLPMISGYQGVASLEDYKYLLKILGDGGVSLKGTPDPIVYDASLIKPAIPTAGTGDWLRDTNAALYLAANADTVINYLWQEVIADPAIGINTVLEGMLKDLLPGLGNVKIEDTLNDTVWGIIGEQTYSTKTLENLIGMVEDFLDGFQFDLEAFDLSALDLSSLGITTTLPATSINLLEIIGKVVTINGKKFDVGKILADFKALTPADYELDDTADTFYKALDNIIGPLLPLLTILLAGGSLEIINLDVQGDDIVPGAGGTYPVDGDLTISPKNVFLNITGPDAYGTVLLPLLMGLVGGFGADGEATLKTQAQFADPAVTSEYQIRAIFEPIIFVLNELMKNPVGTLLTLLPNLLYLIVDADATPGAQDESILQQALTNMLNPLQGILDILDDKGVLKIDNIALGGSTLDLTSMNLDEMLNGLLEGLLGKAPVDIASLVIGVAGEFTTDVKKIALNEDAYYADLTDDVKKAEVLMALIELLLDGGIDKLQNFKYLLEILGDGGLDLSEIGLIDYDEDLIKPLAAAPTVAKAQWLRDTDAAKYLGANMDSVINYLWKSIVADEDIGIKQALEGFLNGLLPEGLNNIAIEDSLAETVWGILGTQTYTETTLWAIVESLQAQLKNFNIPIGENITIEDLEAFDLSDLEIKGIELTGTVNLFALIDKLLFIGGEPLGTTLSTVIDTFFGLKQADFEIDDRDDFYTALNTIIEPLMPILNILLAGDGLEIINLTDTGLGLAGTDEYPVEGVVPQAFLSIKGPDAYGTVILPLLMGLVGGLDGEANNLLMTPDDYKDADSEGQIEAIFEPIMYVVDQLLKNPVSTLLRLLPNLLYLIAGDNGTQDFSIVQQALTNMINPLTGILDFVNDTFLDPDNLDPTKRIKLNDLLNDSVVSGGDGSLNLTNLQLDELLNTTLNNLLDPTDAKPDFDLMGLILGVATQFSSGVEVIATNLAGEAFYVDYLDSTDPDYDAREEVLIKLLDIALPLVSGYESIASLKKFEELLKILGKGGYDFNENPGKITYDPLLIEDEAPYAGTSDWLRNSDAALYLASNADTVIEFLWKEVIANDDVGVKTSLEDLLAGVMPGNLPALTIEDTLKETVWQVFGHDAYTTDNIEFLVETLKDLLRGFDIPIGAGIKIEDLAAFDLNDLKVDVDGDGVYDLNGKVNLLKIIGKVVKINGESFDVDKILTDFMALTPADYTILGGADAEASFYAALNKIVGPLLPVVTVLLAGGSLELVNKGDYYPEVGIVPEAFLSITGPDAYGTVLLPILMALVGGLGGEGDLKTQKQFVEGGSAVQIEAIFKPIMFVIEKLLTAPTDTLLKLIPNILYLFKGDETVVGPPSIEQDTSILQQAVTNLINPLEFMLKFVNDTFLDPDNTNPAGRIDLTNIATFTVGTTTKTLDLTNLQLDEFLNDLLSGALSSTVDLMTLVIGLAELFDADVKEIATADKAYYADLTDVEKAELIMAILDMFVPGGIDGLEKYDTLFNILGKGGIDLASEALIKYDPDLIAPEAVNAGAELVSGEGPWLRATKAADYLAANADTVINFLWKNVIADDNSGMKTALEDFINNILPASLSALGPVELKSTLSATVWDIIGTQTYTNTTLFALVEQAQDWLKTFEIPIGGGLTLADLKAFNLSSLDSTLPVTSINLLELIAQVVSINGVRLDVGKILSDFYALSPTDFIITDDVTFYAALTKIIEPLLPVLSILLAGGDLEIINIDGKDITDDELFPMDGGVRPDMEGKASVFLNIKGPDAYGNVLLPLLMGLVGGFGADGEDTLKTPDAFRNGTPDVQVKAIFEPIVFVIDRLLKQPVDTLLKLIPNILFLIAGDNSTQDISIVQQALDNMLAPIETKILPIVNQFLDPDNLDPTKRINLGDVLKDGSLDLTNLQLDEMLNDLINNAMGSSIDLTGLVIGGAFEFDTLKTAIIGERKADGEKPYANAVALESYEQMAELLIAAIDMFVGIDKLEDYAGLIDILGDGGINLSGDKKIDYALAGDVLPEALDAGTDGWLRDTNAAQYLAANLDTVIDFLWKEVVIADKTAAPGDENGILNLLETLIDNLLPDAMFTPGDFELQGSLKDTVYQIFGNQTFSTDNIELLINEIKYYLDTWQIPVAALGDPTIASLNDFDLSILGVDVDGDGFTDLNGHVNLLAVIGKIATINGAPVDVEGIINNFLALTRPDYTVNSPDDFYTVLNNVIGPLMPVLSVLLAGNGLEIIKTDANLPLQGKDLDASKPDVFFNITGPDAYGTVLLPLLMGLVGGLGGEGLLMSPTDFATTTDTEAQIKAIFEPIMFVIDGIVTKPVETLLKLIPNLLYLITDGNDMDDDSATDESILQQALTNMLTPMAKMVDIVNDLAGTTIDITNISGFSLLDMHIDKILADLLSSMGIDLKTLIVGERTPFSGNLKDVGFDSVEAIDPMAYYVEVEPSELIIALIGAFLDIDADLKNFEILLQILGQGGLDLSGGGEKIDYTKTPNALPVVYPDWFKKDEHAQYLVDNLDLTINWLWETLVYDEPDVTDLIVALADEYLGITLVIEPTLDKTIWGALGAVEVADILSGLIVKLQDLLGDVDIMLSDFEDIDVSDLLGNAPGTDSINLMAILAKILKVGGDPLDVVAIIDSFMALVPADFEVGGTYHITDMSDIVPMLQDLLGPLMPVLSILLVGGDLELITLEDGEFPFPGVDPSVFLTIKGGDYYGSVILPLLIGLGGGVPNFLDLLEAPDTFKTLSGEDQVAAIFDPIIFLIDELLKNPVTTLMQVLPNVMYIISSTDEGDSVLQQAMNNILTPVITVLDLLVGAGVLAEKPAILDDLATGTMDIEAIVNELLETIKPGAGLTTKDFIVGTRMPIKFPLSEVGKRNIAYYIEPDAADMLTQLLDKFGVFELLEDNSLTFLIGLLGNEAPANAPDKLDYGFTPEPMAVTYFDWFQKVNDAQYLVDNADAVVHYLYDAIFADNMIGKTNISKIAGINLEDTLADTFAQIFPEDGNIYIQYYYDMILNLVKNLIGGLNIDLTNFDAGEPLGLTPGDHVLNLLDLIGKLVYVDGGPLDVQAILDPFMNYTAGDPAYDIVDEQSFKDQLVLVLAPLMPIVNVFLAGTDIKIIDNSTNTTGQDIINNGNGFISIFGYNGYERGLLPILMALGADFGQDYLDLLLPVGAYAAATAEDQVLAIIEPILYLLNQLVKNPITTILRILPNVLYFITDETTPAGSPSLLQQCIDRLLFPITSMGVLGDLADQSNAKLADLQKKFAEEDERLKPERDTLAAMRSAYDATITAAQRALMDEIGSLRNQIGELNKKLDASDRKRLLRNVQADPTAFDAEIADVTAQKTALETQLAIVEPQLVYTAAQQAMQAAIGVQAGKCANKYEGDLNSEKSLQNILGILSGKELKLGDTLNGLLETLLPSIGLNAFKLERLITGEKTEFPAGYKEVGVNGVNDEADFIKVDMADLLTQLLSELGVFLLLEENNLTSLVKLLNPNEAAEKGKMPGPIVYGTVNMVGQKDLYPTCWWRRSHAGYIADNAEDLINKLIFMFTGKTLGYMKANGKISANTILSDLLGDSLFTQQNFDSLLGLVQNVIPDLDAILKDNDTITGAETLLNRTIKDLAFKIVAINGENFDLLHLLKHLKTWKPVDPVTDQASFIKNLLDYLEPIVPVLDFLLAGEDIRLMEDATIDGGKGLLKTFGYQGYRFGLIPILEAFLVPLGAINEITKPEDYVERNDRDKLEAILDPILYFVKTLLANPINVILNVMPNVAYFISNETSAYKPTLQQSVDRILYTLNYLGLGTILGMDSNDPESLITLDVMSILNGIIGGTGLKINASILNRFIIGTLVDYTSLSGGPAKYVDSNSRLGRADLITALFRVLTEIWRVKENRDAIYEIVLGLGIVKGFTFKILKGIIELCTKMSFALGKWGIDLAINAFFRHFYWATKWVNVIFALFFKKKFTASLQSAATSANFATGLGQVAAQPVSQMTSLSKVWA